MRNLLTILVLSASLWAQGLLDVFPVVTSNCSVDRGSSYMEEATEDREAILPGAVSLPRVFGQGRFSERTAFFIIAEVA